MLEELKNLANGDSEKIKEPVNIEEKNDDNKIAVEDEDNDV